MNSELSPICKALISFFASEPTPQTIDNIEAALPGADLRAVRSELQMLVRVDVVSQAARYEDECLVYWLSGARVAPFHHTRLVYPDATFADVGGIHG
ncbi:hypothetical protein [Paraburkholderia caribensis]|uniref:hypothetical protein n=1 Tax=Paraburkholderia caribensis TaxID=75105 RepID=UPI000721F3B9|nr:hypothetical protein [Paraburkholderia caribensis]ALP62375.1 hypothetical protein AN416_07030 [Paraburkholderia caribensis]AUT52397.1 hypothetical protein C2L66_11385 [Paraburkholderia caribensis]